MEVNLDSNEIIVAEAGAMVYMTPQINVKTRKREEKSILQSLKTSFLGSESFFLNEYVADKGSGKVGFVPAPVGDHIRVERSPDLYHLEPVRADLHETVGVPGRDVDHSSRGYLVRFPVELYSCASL